MIFNKHSAIEGSHAFLSASKYHWINYDDDKLDRMFATHEAARRGTELHELAHNLIRLGVRLPKTQKTLNMYVNDAIGFRMTPEQPLFYSNNCFGTPDAISFRNNTLRVHDLKTGVIPAHIEQLEVYGALFCLEYKYQPVKIKTEFRIYQNDETQIYEGDPHEMTRIMSKIISFDRRLNARREEALG